MFCSKRGFLQKHANERRRALKQERKRVRKNVPPKNCKQPGLKQPGLGTPKISNTKRSSLDFGDGPNQFRRGRFQTLSREFFALNISP